MGRIRSVKPETFTDEQLWDAEQTSRLPIIRAFVGLWTQCDREGRFLWRPRMLKVNILPYDDLDFGEVLAVLARQRWVVPYEVEGQMYGYVRTWNKHQFINHRESDSVLPAPTPENIERAHRQLDFPFDASATREARDDDASATREARDTGKHGHARGEGKGREGKGREGNGTERSRVPCPPAAAVASLLLNDGSLYHVSREYVEHAKDLFRGVDVENELRLMTSWCESNPTRRKTSGGIERFIHTWLSKEQDRSKAPATPAQKPRGTTADATEIARERRARVEQNRA